MVVSALPKITGSEFRQDLIYQVGDLVARYPENQNAYDALWELVSLTELRQKFSF